ncbi:hypothetical protein FRC03_006550 [Tulasnella sp. 419]|nr:hypothetical protein FRC03_006550 [Tulasnella sp. 419]
MEEAFPRRSVVTICYTRVLWHHSLEELQSPSDRTDENVLAFLQALDEMWPPRWGMVAYNLDTNFRRLTDSYQVLCVLCDGYDLNRLRINFIEDWEKERRIFAYASVAFELQINEWMDRLQEARSNIRINFFAVYNNLPVVVQGQYAHYLVVFNN